MHPTLSPTELLATLNARYATKLFDSSKTIDDKLWQSFLESLRLTPSSLGIQPWHFITVTSPSLKKDLLPVSWNQPQVTDCSHLLVLCAKRSIQQKDIDCWINTLAAARNVQPEELQGFSDMMQGYLGALSPEEQLHWATNQVFIALGQCCLAAALLGLDTCALGGIDKIAYNKLLDLEDSPFTTSVACAVGYRSDEDKYASLPKARFSLEQIMTSL